jgi:hypothetical protein
VSVCVPIIKRGVCAFVFANNHYAGHSPATVESFRRLLDAEGVVERAELRQLRQESTLFDNINPRVKC